MVLQIVRVQISICLHIRGPKYVNFKKKSPWPNINLCKKSSAKLHAFSHVVSYWVNVLSSSGTDRSANPRLWTCRLHGGYVWFDSTTHTCDIVAWNPWALEQIGKHKALVDDNWQRKKQSNHWWSWNVFFGLDMELAHPLQPCANLLKREPWTSCSDVESFDTIFLFPWGHELTHAFQMVPHWPKARLWQPRHVQWNAAETAWILSTKGPGTQHNSVMNKKGYLTEFNVKQSRANACFMKMT